MRTQYIDTIPIDWQPIANIFAALGDVTRQKIVLLFEPNEELSIKEITAVFPLSRTSIVHHLSALETANILSVRKEGKNALYSVQYHTIYKALSLVQDFISEELHEALQSKHIK